MISYPLTSELLFAYIHEAMITRKVIPFSVRFQNSTVFVLAISAIVRVTACPVVIVDFTSKMDEVKKGVRDRQADTWKDRHRHRFTDRYSYSKILLELGIP